MQFFGGRGGGSRVGGGGGVGNADNAITAGTSSPRSGEFGTYSVTNASFREMYEQTGNSEINKFEDKYFDGTFNLDLPKLTGVSEKQIAYAEKVRAKVINSTAKSVFEQFTGNKMSHDKEYRQRIETQFKKFETAKGKKFQNLGAILKEGITVNHSALISETSAKAILDKYK